jgi:hypothetical protein
VLLASLPRSLRGGRAPSCASAGHKQPRANGYSRFLQHVCLPAAPEEQLWQAKLTGEVVKEKKYTEDHEWIEASADGKTCM